MTGMQARPKLSWFSVVFVALKDLNNERLISFCLVLSVVAVLTPILLLTSVKVGFIDRLKSEFIEDPGFREVRPQGADVRHDSFFADVAKWNGVVFVMPSVMLVPREVDFVAEQGGARKRGSAKLWPSAANDPLFDKLEGEPPTGDNVVVSADVAREANLTIGSTLDLGVSRIENDKRRGVVIHAVVVGTIPEERVPQPTIFAERTLDRQFENFRAGIAVPERGWPGVRAVPKQAFQRLLVVTPEPLGETALANLRIRVGAATLNEVDYPLALNGMIAGGTPLADPAGSRAGQHFYVIEKSGNSYVGSDVDEAKDVLRNQISEVIGENLPLDAELFGQSISLAGIDPRLSAAVKALPGNWAIRTGAPFGLNDGVFLPERLRDAWTQAGSNPVIKPLVRSPDGWEVKELTLRLRVLGFVPGDVVVASPALLAMLYRGKDVPLGFDVADNNLVELSTGYRGFRAVAGDINDVPALVEHFKAAGVAVRARSDEILKLQSLERSLDILVAVVAAVALAGGFSILSSSFFANVQRKRVDFATMRLIGMSKAAVFQIPLAQATMVAILGFLLAFIAYFVVSWFLNRVIAAQLGFDGQLSKLYVSHFVFVAAFVVIGSLLASLAASREATRIDPAQAMRAG